MLEKFNNSFFESRAVAVENNSIDKRYEFFKKYIFREKKMKNLLFCLLFLLILVSGCAAKNQNIYVTSDPPSVKVSDVNGVSITTPGIFDLRRNQNHTLVAEYPGVAKYPGVKTQQREIKHGNQGKFWGNNVLGGITGGVEYTALGSSDKLIPDRVHFDFTITGQSSYERKRKYLEKNPTDEKICFAIWNELSTKGMNIKQLEASYGPPNQIVQERGYEKFIYNSRTPQFYFFKKEILKKVK